MKVYGFLISWSALTGVCLLLPLSHHHKHHHYQKRLLSSHDIPHLPHNRHHRHNHNDFTEEEGIHLDDFCSDVQCDNSVGLTLVCGSDGRVYASNCYLHKAACLRNKSHIKLGAIPCNHLQKNNLVDFHNGEDLDDFLESDRALSFNGTVTSSKEILNQDDGGNLLEDFGKESRTQEGNEHFSNLYEHHMGVPQDKSIHFGSFIPCPLVQFELLRSTLFSLNVEELKGIIWDEDSLDKRSLYESTDHTMGDGPEADKDNLIQSIFSTLDQNNDFLLDYIELFQGDAGNFAQKLDSNCQLRDFLVEQDFNGDGKVHLTEFYSGFSHLYGVTMISLEKALEWQRIWMKVGESMLLKCDVIGSPPTPIRWTTTTRYTSPSDLSKLKEHIHVNVDGTLQFKDVQVSHTGNYSCHSPRNSHVIQTYSLIVTDALVVKINPKMVMEYPGGELTFECNLNQDLFMRESSKWMWFHNGIMIKNDDLFAVETSKKDGKWTRLSLKNGNASRHSGTYSCEVTTSWGATAADTATLVILKPQKSLPTFI